jgi:hypothetical protein
VSLLVFFFLAVSYRIYIYKNVFYTSLEKWRILYKDSEIKERERCSSREIKNKRHFIKRDWKASE